MKYISIIGSTGSIGTQTLDIVRSNKDLKVTALAAGTSIDLLEKQAREFQPVIVAVYNVSLLASAMSFPAFIAAIVGRIPIIPTIAVTTTEHCSCVAASNNPSKPAQGKYLTEKAGITESTGSKADSSCEWISDSRSYQKP